MPESFLPILILLGLALELLHGFKIQWYLAVANDTRRLLWTLAHAHGVLLGVVNVVYALSLRTFPVRGSRMPLSGRPRASPSRPTWFSARRPRRSWLRWQF